MTTLAELILRADYRQIDGANTALDNMSDTGQKATNTLKNLAATLGLAFGVREVLQAAEAYTNMTNKLKLVTDSSEELVAAQEQLFQISQETRQPLSATSELYQKLAQNADTLGLSLGEVGRITETINKLITLSGSSSEAAGAAITQLAQGLASGALRGDELNSVMEQTPALAKAIADGMGITIGQLRAMGAEGKITTDVLINAIKKQGDAVDSQFAKMAPNISQAMTTVENSLTRFIGRIDGMAGATIGLSSNIADLSKSIDDIDLGPAVEMTALWATGLKSISADVGQVTSFISTLSGGVDLFRAFAELPVNISAAYRIIKAQITETFDDVAVVAENTGKRISSALFSGAITAGAEWDAANAAQVAGLQKNADVRESTINKILSERDATIALAKAKRDIYEAEQKYLSDGDILNAKGAPTGGKTTDKAAEEKRRKEAERAAKWLEEQKIYWSNEIVAEMDKIASQSEMENKAYADKLLRLQQQFGTESELEQLAYAKKLEDYAAYAEMIGLSEEAQRQQRERMEKEHSDRLLAISKKSSDEKRSHTQKALGDLSTLMNTGSRKLFEIGKAAALANALISAKESVVDAWKWGNKLGGPPLGAAFAAAAAVAQAANISAIASTSFGGGSSTSSNSGTSVPTADTSGIQAQQPARTQTVDFRIERRGNRGWDDEDVAELMSAIGERVKDGAKFGRVEFVVT